MFTRRAGAFLCGKVVVGPLLEFLTLSSFGGPRGHNGDGSGAAVGAVLPVSCVYTGTDCLKEELQELPFHAKLLAGHHRARPSPASGAPTALRRDAQAAHPAPAEVPAAAARRVSASCVDDHPLSALRRPSAAHHPRPSLHASPASASRVSSSRDPFASSGSAHGTIHHTSCSAIALRREVNQ